MALRLKTKPNPTRYVYVVNLTEKSRAAGPPAVLLLRFKRFVYPWRNTLLSSGTIDVSREPYVFMSRLTAPYGSPYGCGLHNIHSSSKVYGFTAVHPDLSPPHPHPMLPTKQNGIAAFSGARFFDPRLWISIQILAGCWSGGRP